MQDAAGAAVELDDAPATDVEQISEVDFEFLVEAAAAGEATPEQIELLGRHRTEWKRVLVRLLDDTEDHLEDLRENLRGPEREQVLADFEGEVARLNAALALLAAPSRDQDGAAPAVEPPGQVRLQASWANGQLVVWAGGPLAPAAGSDQLEMFLAALGAPSSGWQDHRPVQLPSGGRAAARAIPVADVLGWLVALGAGEVAATADDGSTAPPTAGSSLVWMGRVAIWAVRLVAQGAMVPVLSGRRRRGGEDVTTEHSVRWAPALVEQVKLEEMAAAMPGAVTTLERSEGRNVTLNLLNAVVDAIARDAAGRLVVPAPPPDPRTTAEVAEAVLFRLDGSTFTAPVSAGAEVAKRLERWAKPVTTPQASRLVVQLAQPDDIGAWLLSVLGYNSDGDLVPVEVALVDSGQGRRLATELARLERILPVVKRPGGQRRGEVLLDTAEAWELMTVDGPALEAAGFEVRVPLLSRRKPTPSLRLTAEPGHESVVGANQITAVRWSAVFDDVELTAAEIQALATQARPLVRSRGRWVELDQADLKEAAAALAERADKTALSGAEMLRHAMGLEGSPLRGGTTLGGSGWATDLLERASEVSTDLDDSPEGFTGKLRSYQAEALAWLGFVDSVELGGILALDMGLGKTPTLLAHLARSASDEPALVIAPPAVVGNWHSEAAKFTSGLRVVVHHGSSRASADDLAVELRDADVLLTTYGTAMRDIDALAERTWSRVVLDEAQAIKNPASETAQQLRRLKARSRIALTGTPVENGLGDLWALLDFTNPGLVGDRASFVSQLSGGDKAKGKAAGEQALRALNGILVFRRTKNEPEVAAELPERIDELDHCTMTAEQIGLYQAVLDGLVASQAEAKEKRGNAEVLAAITALKQICNHPVAYRDDGGPLEGRSGKLARLEEIVDAVFAAEERVLVFTHFAEWGKRLAAYLTEATGHQIDCYHGGLARGARDAMIKRFQEGEGAGALVLSLKAGGTGLNLTAANHVVLYDRWWNPAVEDQARDRAWRIGQTRTVISHRLVCPGTVDERVEEVVQGKRHIADLVLPASSSLADLDSGQLRVALGLRPELLLTEEDDPTSTDGGSSGEVVASGQEESDADAVSVGERPAPDAAGGDDAEGDRDDAGRSQVEGPAEPLATEEAR